MQQQFDIYNVAFDSIGVGNVGNGRKVNSGGSGSANGMIQYLPMVSYSANSSPHTSPGPSPTLHYANVSPPSSSPPSSSSEDNYEQYNFIKTAKFGIGNNNGNHTKSSNNAKRRHSLPSKQKKVQIPQPMLSPIINYNPSNGYTKIVNKQQYQQQLHQRQQQQHQIQQLHQQQQQKRNAKNNLYTHFNSDSDDEFFETNSDFSKLSVSNRDDLEVCLSVLKNEIHQFKNLSDNLHGRIVQLEKGVGDERSTMSHSPPPFDLVAGTDETSANSTLMDPSETKELLTNCFSEINRLLEKQHQYEALLAQREQFWEAEIDSIRTKLLDQHSNSSSMSSLPSIARDEYLDEMDDAVSSSSSSSSIKSYKFQAQAIQLQSQATQTPQRQSIFKRIYMFVFGPQSNIWRKVIVLSIVVIVWPIVSHFLWRAFSRWIAGRRARKAGLASASVAIGSSQPLSQLQSTITNAKNSSKSKIGSSSSNSKKKNISAPDIVKAFIQGVSTGDGGSNDNITNNAISTLSNTLNSLTPVASLINSNINSAGSAISSNSSAVSGIGSAAISIPSNIVNNISNTSSIGGTGSSIAAHLTPSPSPSAVATLSPAAATTSLLSNSKDRVRDTSQRFMVKLVKNILKGDPKDD